MFSFLQSLCNHITQNNILRVVLFNFKWSRCRTDYTKNCNIRYICIFIMEIFLAESKSSTHLICSPLKNSNHKKREQTADLTVVYKSLRDTLHMEGHC